MPHNNSYSTYSVYTIKHSDDLNKAYKKGGVITFTEKTNWKSGATLLKAAQKKKLIMPVLFCGAETTWNLLYWGKLKHVKIVRKSEKSYLTTYRFIDLRKIRGHIKTDLVLKSSGNKMAEGNIRPYAICFTPKFLK